MKSSGGEKGESNGVELALSSSDEELVLISDSEEPRAALRTLSMGAPLIVTRVQQFASLQRRAGRVPRWDSAEA